MEDTLKKVGDAITAIAQGRKVELSPEEALELAQKGAEALGALVSDHAWKKAKAAGDAAAAQVTTMTDAQKFNQEN